MNKDSLIEFPCDFPIKIIGNNTTSFVDDILAIVNAHFPALDTALITKNLSKDSKYISLTVTVFAENQNMLDAFYQDVTNHPDIKMVL